METFLALSRCFGRVPGSPLGAARLRRPAVCASADTFWGAGPRFVPTLTPCTAADFRGILPRIVAKTRRTPFAVPLGVLRISLATNRYIDLVLGRVAPMTQHVVGVAVATEQKRQWAADHGVIPPLLSCADALDGSCILDTR